jgi:hypothetical protein
MMAQRLQSANLSHCRRHVLGGAKMRRREFIMLAALLAMLPLAARAQQTAKENFTVSYDGG